MAKRKNIYRPLTGAELDRIMARIREELREVEFSGLRYSRKDCPACHAHLIINFGEGRSKSPTLTRDHFCPGD